MAENEAKEVKLTDKQKLFVGFYLGVSRCNATDAARRAGYAGDAVTLAAVGYENLRKPQISKLISECVAMAGMGADEVLSRLSEQARADQSQFFEDDLHGGVFVNLNKLTEAGYGHLVKKIKRDALTRRITEVEFYDSQAALVQLGRHHKLFTDKTEVSGEIVAGVVRLPAKAKETEWPPQPSNEPKK